MAKRPSLESLARPPDNGTTASPDNVVALQRRPSLPHVSVYIGRPVQREIKQIALTYDRRPHDLYLEALDLLLAKYGRPDVATLSGGNGTT